MSYLNVSNVKKVYERKGVRTEALSNVTFSVNQGEFVAIMGESGSGKTTLLNILSTLDTPTSGKVILDGTDLSTLKESQIARFRRENLGFVFQDFNLLDHLTNKDNILLPLVLSDESYKSMMEKLQIVARKLGIETLLNKYPYEVSGGQKQRIALARAIITNPSIILADEPTGALDSHSSQVVMDLLTKINQENETVLMVTHSAKCASNASRVLFIKDGIIYHEIYRGELSQEEFFERISESIQVLERRGV